MKALLSLIFALGIVGAHGAGSDAKEPPKFIRPIAAIKIPKIEAKDATLADLVDFLAHRIVELDPNPPGGITFLFGDFKDQDPGKRRDYATKDARVDQVMRDLARLFDAEFHVTEVGMIVTPKGGDPFPNPKAKTGTTYYTYRATGEPPKAVTPDNAKPARGKSGR